MHEELADAELMLVENHGTRAAWYCVSAVRLVRDGSDARDRWSPSLSGNRSGRARW
ncbi:hypothetical protein ACWD5V_41220 [Streptomyces sp. NPDC002523]